MSKIAKNIIDNNDYFFYLNSDNGINFVKKIFFQHNFDDMFILIVNRVPFLDFNHCYDINKNHQENLYLEKMKNYEKHSKIHYISRELDIPCFTDNYLIIENQIRIFNHFLLEKNLYNNEDFKRLVKNENKNQYYNFILNEGNVFLRGKHKGKDVDYVFDFDRNYLVRLLNIFGFPYDNLDKNNIKDTNYLLKFNQFVYNYLLSRDYKYNYFEENYNNFILNSNKINLNVELINSGIYSHNGYVGLKNTCQNDDGVIFDFYIEKPNAIFNWKIGEKRNIDLFYKDGVLFGDSKKIRLVKENKKQYSLF